MSIDVVSRGRVVIVTIFNKDCKYVCNGNFYVDGKFLYNEKDLIEYVLTILNQKLTVDIESSIIVIKNAYDDYPNFDSLNIMYVPEEMKKDINVNMKKLEFTNQLNMIHAGFRYNDGVSDRWFNYAFINIDNDGRIKVKSYNFATIDEKTKFKNIEDAKTFIEDKFIKQFS